MSKAHRTSLPELSHRFVRWILLGCLAISGIGQSFIFTSLPPIGREIGLSDVQISSVITAGATVFVFSSVLWGRLIPRIGQIRSIVIGMICYTVTIGCTGMVLHAGIEGVLGANVVYLLILLLRLIFASLVAGVYPSIQAYLISWSGVRNRAALIASLSAAFSLGMISGPALSTFSSSVSLVLPFFLIAIASGVGALLTFLQVKESGASLCHDVPDKVNWLSQPVRPFLMMSLLIILSLTGIQQIFGFLVQDRFGWDAVQTTQKAGYGLMLMSILIIMMQVLVVSRLHLSPLRLIGFGLLFCGLSFYGFLIISDYKEVLVVMGLLGVGVGLLYPGVITSQTLIVADGLQSQLAATNAAVQGVGAALGPITMTALYQMDQVWPFRMLILGLLVLVYLFWHNKSLLVDQQKSEMTAH